MTNTTLSITKTEQEEPLELLIKRGKLPPIDSVAFGSLSNQYMEMSKAEAKDFISNVMHNSPLLVGVYDTCLGRIGAVVLPVLYEEIYLDDSLISSIEKGIALSNSLGARCTSLTGLIPSATSYGIDINLGENKDILLSTGHGATISAMVFNIDNALSLAKRNIELETFAFVGLGAIGSCTLELMLAVLKHPKKIILCDVFSKQQDLQKIYRKLIDYYNFKGEILLLNPTDISLPKLIYQEASIIIGATNVPNIIEASALKSGTIIVDDSAPHIFDVNLCLERVKQNQDILVIQGGKIALPKPTSLTIDFNFKQWSSVFISDPNEMMGCILGSILPLVDEKLLPTIGLVAPQIALTYYSILKEKGIKGSSLQCADYSYSRANIEHFSQLNLY